MNSNKTLNGLVDIECDTIKINYYNVVNGNQLIYIQNV